MPPTEALLRRILQFFRARTNRTTHYECRRCGCTLSRDASACTTCGSDEIATIVLN